MARITVEDCIEKINNRFDLVVFAAQRGREISAGDQITIERDNDKNTVVSLREIAESTVDVKELKENLILSMQKQIVEEENENEDETEEVISDSGENIINDRFRVEHFDPESFDVICVFQVFDHLLDLNHFVSSIKSLLKPGGIILAVNHNIQSWMTKILGEKSPHYVTAHMYLFDLNTMGLLYNKHGMEVVKSKGICSLYAIDHIIKMLPFPKLVKTNLIKLFNLVGLSGLSIRLPGGNMVSVARKVS